MRTFDQSTGIVSPHAESSFPRPQTLLEPQAGNASQTIYRISAVVEAHFRDCRYLIRVFELLLTQFVMVLPRAPKIFQKTSLRDADGRAHGKRLPIRDRLCHFPDFRVR